MRQNHQERKGWEGKNTGGANICGTKSNIKSKFTSIVRNSDSASMFSGSDLLPIVDQLELCSASELTIDW